MATHCLSVRTPEASVLGPQGTHIHTYTTDAHKCMYTQAHTHTCMYTHAPSLQPPKPWLPLQGAEVGGGQRARFPILPGSPAGICLEPGPLHWPQLIGSWPCPGCSGNPRRKQETQWGKGWQGRRWGVDRKQECRVKPRNSEGEQRSLVCERWEGCRAHVVHSPASGERHPNSGLAWWRQHPWTSEFRDHRHLARPGDT